MKKDVKNPEPAKVVARVSSPSSNTDLTLDIVDDATQRKLVGSLVGLEWEQTDATAEASSEKTAVLGQITSVEMRNRWHEDQTFKNIVKSRGEVPAITKLQDTRTATMKVGGCFVQRPGGIYGHGDLGSVPDTGLEVNLVRQKFLDGVLRSCKDDLFYLGNDYAGNIKFPMWFKHFGRGDHGVGEAYHTGIFGKTGSGKTGLAKMLLAAYGRHTEMGILVIDPQGEFTLEMGGSRGEGHENARDVNHESEQGLDLRKLLKEECDREVNMIRIEKLQLDSWELLEEFLDEFRFVQRVLRVRGSDNAATALRVLMGYLRSQNLEWLTNPACMQGALKELRERAGDIYNTPGARKRFEDDMDRVSDESSQGNEFADTWRLVMSMFEDGNGKRKIGDLVSDLVRGLAGSKPIIVLNLSGGPKHARYAEALQKRIISYVANQIVEESAKTLGSGKTANALVVLDEAHRFAPAYVRDTAADGDRMLRDELKRAVRETRKYGVGWMFISQTMMGLDSELLMQLRSMFFGYGLAFGLEFQRLRELAGGDNDAMDLYRSFRDPHSAMDSDSKQFPFMAIGPISPMPFSGQPLFFSAFKPDEFREKNVWERSKPGNRVVR